MTVHHDDALLRGARSLSLALRGRVATLRLAVPVGEATPLTLGAQPPVDEPAWARALARAGARIEAGQEVWVTQVWVAADAVEVVLQTLHEPAAQASALRVVAAPGGPGPVGDPGAAMRALRAVLRFA